MSDKAKEEIDVWVELGRCEEKCKRLRALLRESKREHGSGILWICAKRSDYLQDYPCTCGADEWNAKVDAEVGDAR